MSDTLSETTSVSVPFPDLSDAACKAMLAYTELLREVFPMKAAHRRGLADNIQELSSFLIEDRKEVLGRDYLHTPAALGAYLWYFLPWNLLRLTRLLGGLELDPPAGANIVDLGAGPLTLVQALALARSDLLDKELHFYCLDTTPKPMREGRKLYHGLLELLGVKQTRWKIHLVHAPWQVGLRDMPQADLLTATNFLNELPWHRRAPLSEQVTIFFHALATHLRADGQGLFVEPGNRLGGKLISLLRESAVASGWNIMAPCSHHQPCPMLDHRETSWCHFILSTRGCPPWLTELSREAELFKRDLSLSFVHMVGPQGRRPSGPQGRRPSDSQGRRPSDSQGRRPSDSQGRRPSDPHERGTPVKEDLARIISAEFPVPDPQFGRMTGRYACAAQGKLLVLSAQGEARTASGDIIPVYLPDKARHDPKSHAMVAMLHAEKAMDKMSNKTREIPPVHRQPPRVAGDHQPTGKRKNG